MGKEYYDFITLRNGEELKIPLIVEKNYQGWIRDINRNIFIGGNSNRRSSTESFLLLKWLVTTNKGILHVC